MGAEVTHGTKAAFLKATKERAEAVLDASIEAEKQSEPFLRGVPAIVDALKSGQIECRRLHEGQVPCQGLHHAREARSHRRASARRLIQLHAARTDPEHRTQHPGPKRPRGRPASTNGSRTHWKQAQDVTPDILQVVDRHVREYSPFDVYAKALHEFFRGHEITAGEWDGPSSADVPGPRPLPAGGLLGAHEDRTSTRRRLLCDGVGLGKTFVGLMLHRASDRARGKARGLVRAKAAKEAVWEPRVAASGSAILAGEARLQQPRCVQPHRSRVARSYQERFARITELADAVIIDEAHHFRNPGVRVRRAAHSLATARCSTSSMVRFDRSRRSCLPQRRSTTGCTDFRHMVDCSRAGRELLRTNPGHQQPPGALRRPGEELRKEFDREVTETEASSRHRRSSHRVRAFKELVVQRSRAYARQSQILEKGSAQCSRSGSRRRSRHTRSEKTYGKLLEDVEAAFSKDKPLFSLAIYYPLAYYRGKEDESS